MTATDDRFPAVSGGQVGNPLSDREIREHVEWLKSPIRAAPTPLPSWDDVCGDDGGGEGVAPGWFVLLSGPSGSGKTLLALNCAAKWIKNGEKVGYIKLEMSDAQIRSRLYTILSGWGSEAFERRSDPDDTDVERAADDLRAFRDQLPEGWGFRYNRYNLRERSTVLGEMSWWAERGTEFFIVDFVQRIRAPEEKGLRDQYIRIAADMADFAEHKGLLVMGVSQMKNQGALAVSKGDRSPVMNDLYGGMGVAQEANQVLMLDHSQYERPPKGAHDRSIANTVLQVAKNRHGDQPAIPVQWDYSNLQIRELMPDEYTFG